MTAPSPPANPTPPCERCSTVEPHRHCPRCGTRLDGRACNICGLNATEAKTEIEPQFRLHDDSRQKETAIRIVALQNAGVSRDEIAQMLGISRGTVNVYLHRASKNGWIEFADPRDSIEFGLLHKVVKNLNDALDDDARNENTGMQVKTAVALKVAEGTVFKQFDTPAQPGGAQAMIGVKIEIVGGEKGTVREGTVYEQEDYVDAEPVENA